jgi:formate-dependent nitrite reductase membrane component NrfD
MDFRVGVVEMKKIIIFIVLFGVYLFAKIENKYIECHAGIKDIRET